MKKKENRTACNRSRTACEAEFPIFRTSSKVVLNVSFVIGHAQVSKIGVSTVAPLWRDLVIILRCKSRQRYRRPNFERPSARKEENDSKTWSSKELPTYPVCRDQTDRSSGLTNLRNTAEGFWKNLDRLLKTSNDSQKIRMIPDGF